MNINKILLCSILLTAAVTNVRRVSGLRSVMSFAPLHENIVPPMGPDFCPPHYPGLIRMSGADINSTAFTMAWPSLLANDSRVVQS
ncbi:MAG: hypothetical protein ACFFEF_11590 [Candidatus Thorarchaeota archaeon]